MVSPHITSRTQSTLRPSKNDWLVTDFDLERSKLESLTVSFHYRMAPGSFGLCNVCNRVRLCNNSDIKIDLLSNVIIVVDIALGIVCTALLSVDI